jgi:hypothetical protein
MEVSSPQRQSIKMQPYVPLKEDFEQSSSLIVSPEYDLEEAQFEPQVIQLYLNLSPTKTEKQSSYL